MKYKTISIPEELEKKIEELIKDTSFPNVSQFICFVMRQILSENKNYDKEVEKEVKKRLKALGYLE